MIFRMMAVLAEFERDQIAERTKVAMSHKKANGERVGTVPYGFDLANDGVQLVPNADEQKAVKRIREMRDMGLSLRKIADRLNEYQIPTKRGGAWVHTSVKSVLTNA